MRPTLEIQTDDADGYHAQTDQLGHIAGFTEQDNTHGTNNQGSQGRPTGIPNAHFNLSERNKKPQHAVVIAILRQREKDVRHKTRDAQGKTRSFPAFAYQGMYTMSAPRRRANEPVSRALFNSEAANPSQRMLQIKTVQQAAVELLTNWKALTKGL